MPKVTSKGRWGEPPPAPEPLPVPVPDSHTHLDLVLDAVGGDADSHLAAAAAVGVDRIIQVGVSTGSSEWAVRLAENDPRVLATVALHPNEAPRRYEQGAAVLDEALARIEALAAHPRVRGIGETGLDYFRTGADGRPAQEHSFRAHIAIAKRHGKALVIHDRDAHADVLRVLDREGAPERVVMHCFSGDAAFARECLRRGFLLSFAGTVTFANARELREAAALTPIDQLLVETDAPYLAPMPHRGRPNGPYLIPLTLRVLAEVAGTDLADLAAAVSANAERVYGPWR